MSNLNELMIRNADGEDVVIQDFSVSSGAVSVYFRDLEDKLIEHINNSEIVLGAVAWLTSFPILDALAKKHVSIVVQKEDFLRPDINSISDRSFESKLKLKYDGLNKNNLSRYSFRNNIVSRLSTSGDYEIDAVRCLGNVNNERKPAFPRMHNKFLVFCKLDQGGDDDYCGWGKVVPYAVWTGSFNLTKNAGMSLENAAYIEDRAIANAYYNEFGNILALSEPLSWFSKWVEPEWRIGT